MKNYLLTTMAAAGLILTGCNQSIETASTKFNELPPAVQKTVRAQAPQGEIAKVDKTTRNGVDAWEVTFREQGKNPAIVVAADGTLLNTDLTTKASGLEKVLTPTGAVGTKFSALPEAVQRTIQSRVPGAQIADIERHEDNGRVIYEVEFTDKGKNPSIRVAEDGTLVQDLQK